MYFNRLPDILQVSSMHYYYACTIALSWLLGVDVTKVSVCTSSVHVVCVLWRMNVKHKNSEMLVLCR